MAETETRRPQGFVVFTGSAAALVVVALVFGTAIGSRPKIDEVEAKRAQQRIETREKLDKSVHEQMTSIAWVDQAKGVVRMPVADAMKVVAAELKARKPAPSQVKVEPPLPMPAPYDPNAAEPPPPAMTSAPQGADNIRFDSHSNGAAPAPTAPAPAPTAPAPAPTAPAPAPTAPVPVPAAPAPAPLPVPAAPAPMVESTRSTAPVDSVVKSQAEKTPARPPLINWTEITK